MLNKVLMGVGMVAVLGLMAAGVAYAVADSGEESGAGGGGGRWQSSGSRASNAGTGDGSGEEQWAGSGSPGGRWLGEAAEAGESTAELEAPVSVSGIVQSVDGSSLVLGTGAGEQIDVSLGRSGYWEAQGLRLVEGDEVVIEGHYEDDGALSASSVTLVATGQTVVLRDENGRPLWAGGRGNGGAGAAPAL